MDFEALKKKYNNQKNGARTRGIGWKLTFDEWVAWWGDDIDNRGVGACMLQMQRFADKGAYELGNIKKGYPRDNSATYGRMCQKRKQDRLAREHQAFLDALIWEPSKEPEEHELYVSEYQIEMQNNGHATEVAFAIDKRSSRK